MRRLRIAPCGSLFITPITPPSRPGLLPLWHLRRGGAKREEEEQSHSRLRKPDGLSAGQAGTKTVSGQPAPRVGFLLLYSAPFHNKDRLWGWLKWHTVAQIGQGDARRNIIMFTFWFVLFVRSLKRQNELCSIWNVRSKWDFSLVLWDLYEWAFALSECKLVLASLLSFVYFLPCSQCHIKSSRLCKIMTLGHIIGMGVFDFVCRLSEKNNSQTSQFNNNSNRKTFKRGWNVLQASHIWRLKLECFMMWLLL